MKTWLWIKTHDAPLKTVAVGLALISSLSLSIAYKGQVNVYKGQVKSLRAALTISCAQREVQHDAVHKAVGADVAYYKGQLMLLESNYANQLKIISSYPKASQAAAIRRVNDNRSQLENVLSRNEAAFVAGTTFECAH